MIRPSCVFKSIFYQLYLFLCFLYLLLQPFVLLLRLVVLLLQPVRIHIPTPPQEPTDVVHCIRVPWLFTLFVELHEDLRQLINCPCFLKVPLKLNFLRIHTLHSLNITSDIIDKIIDPGRVIIYSHEII